MKFSTVENHLKENHLRRGRKKTKGSNFIRVLFNKKNLISLVFDVHVDRSTMLIGGGSLKGLRTSIILHGRGSIEIPLIKPHRILSSTHSTETNS